MPPCACYRRPRAPARTKSRVFCFRGGYAPPRRLRLKFKTISARVKIKRALRRTGTEHTYPYTHPFTAAVRGILHRAKIILRRISYRLLEISVRNMHLYNKKNKRRCQYQPRCFTFLSPRREAGRYPEKIRRNLKLSAVSKRVTNRIPNAEKSSHALRYDRRRHGFIRLWDTFMRFSEALFKSLSKRCVAEAVIVGFGKRACSLAVGASKFLSPEPKLSVFFTRGKGQRSFREKLRVTGLPLFRRSREVFPPRMRRLSLCRRLSDWFCILRRLTENSRHFKSPSFRDSAA